MLTLDIAKRLHTAGLTWSPARGDRFIVPGKDMDDEVFVVSDMTVDVHDFPSGRVIGFNGTTEWALDSIKQDEVVWLPREDQLRVLLGESFVRLEAVPGGFVVVAAKHGRERRHIDIDAEGAYGRCLLDFLTD